MFENVTSIGVINRLSREIYGIQQKFGINWNHVIWEDLAKPLYSALAARLFLQVRSSNATIPGPIKLQAQFWKRYYRFNADNVYVGYFGNLFIDQGESLNARIVNLCSITEDPLLFLFHL